MSQRSILICSVAFLAIGFSVQAATVNDLEVTAITAPNPPVAGISQDIKVTVKNTGETDLTAMAGLSDYRFECNEFSVGKVTLPDVSAAKPLKVGKTVTYTVNGTFNEQDEEATIFFRVNANDSLYESDLTDNDMRVKVTPVSPYNLLVKSIVMHPANPAPGDPCHITVTVVNDGHRDLSSGLGFTSYQYDFGDFKFDRLEKPLVTSAQPVAVKGGVKYVLYGTWPTAGEKHLSFSVDTDAQLDERLETDNTLEEEFTINPASSLDLKVMAIELSQPLDRLIINTPLTITATIQNVGGISLTKDTGLRETRYLFDGFNVDTSRQDEFPTYEEPLDNEDEYEYVYTGRFTTPGVKNLLFEMNKDGKLADGQASNNILTVPVTVHPDAKAADAFTLGPASAGIQSGAQLVINWVSSAVGIGEVRYREKGYTEFVLERIVPRLAAWPREKASTTAHSVTIMNLSPGKIYEFQPVVRRYTNTVIGATHEVTMPLTDTVLITGGPSVSVGADRVTVRWTTNLSTDGVLYYKSSGAAKYNSVSSSTPSAVHSFTVAKLKGGTYEWYVTSKNVAGRSVTSATAKFQIGSSATAVEEEMDDDSAESPVIPAKPVLNDVHFTGIVNNSRLYRALKGKIILTVEDKGQAYYVHPSANSFYFLGRPADAFAAMRQLGAGITDAELKKIPVAVTALTGPDSDADGLPDAIESAIGTDKDKADTDGDGFKDGAELAGGFDPTKGGGAGSAFDTAFANKQKGRILLQVQAHGEAWYVNPADGKRYFLGRPADAFAVMRKLGIGISNRDFASL